MTIMLPDGAAIRAEFARRRFACVPRFLPEKLATEWAEMAATVSCEHAVPIVRGGEDRLSYLVVTGEAIREHWPSLFALYQSEGMRLWVAQVTGEPRIFTSPHLASAININRLESPDNIYRWHYDAVAYTLLLYLTSTGDAGGALEIIDPGSGELVRIPPEAGLAVLMDGTKCRHRSAPLTRPTLRLSIPMVYPATRQHQRPPDLDEYLYASPVRAPSAPLRCDPRQ
jgi:hypothetical protein